MVRLIESIQVSCASSFIKKILPVSTDYQKLMEGWSPITRTLSRHSSTLSMLMLWLTLIINVVILSTWQAPASWDDPIPNFSVTYVLFYSLHFNLLVSGFRFSLKYSTGGTVMFSVLLALFTSSWLHVLLHPFSYSGHLPYPPPASSIGN